MCFSVVKPSSTCMCNAQENNIFPLIIFPISSFDISSIELFYHMKSMNQMNTCVYEDIFWKFHISISRVYTYTSDMSIYIFHIQMWNQSHKMPLRNFKCIIRFAYKSKKYARFLIPNAADQLQYVNRTL